MRLRIGAPLLEKPGSPEAWVRALKRKGYSAAYAPLDETAPDALIAEYRQAARENDIVIAEVGAWLLHPLAEDPVKAREGIEKTAEKLAFADKLGAHSCVNVSTSRGPVWDGPDPRNLTEETFDMVVESVKEILRLADPKEACYSLEMMPWMFPTGLEDQQRLMDAVDHPRFGVHYDPCNTVNTVERYFGNGEMMEKFIAHFGEKLLGIHVKDVYLHGYMTMHFEERRPGLGGMRHDKLLAAVAKHCPGAPLMCEHLRTAEEYDLAVAHLRAVADGLGLEYDRPMELP